MQELFQQILSVGRGMWSFRWPALVVAWVVGLIGAVIAFTIPNQYEATARIYVDTQSILRPLMQGLAVQPNVQEQVGMLSRTLISRPNIEKLIRMADLDLKSTSKLEQEALIDSLTKTIQIRSTGRDNLYTMTYAESDKDKAKRVVQSMVSIFVESSLGATRKDTDSAKVFLDEQIKSYEKKLEEAEARLKEFKLRNLELQSEDGKDATGKLQASATQLEAAKLELREAENSRDAARRQLEAEKQALGGASSGNQEAQSAVATPEIDGRIDALKRNLDGLLQRFTEQHPDVINTRRLLKDLEDQKRKEVAELRKAALASPPGTVGPNSSLAAQELSRAAAAAEVQVAALKARVAEYQSRFNQARSAMKVAPQIEAEAAQLNRDYGIIKKNYDDLVARRQAASLSGELDMASGIADFRLIDPPRVGDKPVSPNRMLLLGAALIAALAAAMGVAFLASQLRPTFHDAHELRVKTGLPLLGVVSLVVDEATQRRNRAGHLRFLAGTGGLLVSFVVAMATAALLASRAAG